ncbi:unnamed protein product, partial [Mesorhabditis spiculigera]
MYQGLVPPDTWAQKDIWQTTAKCVGLLGLVGALLYIAARITKMRGLSYRIYFVETISFPALRRTQVTEIDLSDSNQFDGQLLPRLRSYYPDFAHGAEPAEMSPPSLIILEPETVNDGNDNIIDASDIGHTFRVEAAARSLNHDDAYHAALAAASVITRRRTNATTVSTGLRFGFQISLARETMPNFAHVEAERGLPMNDPLAFEDSDVEDEEVDEDEDQGDHVSSNIPSSSGTPSCSLCGPDPPTDDGQTPNNEENQLSREQPDVPPTSVTIKFLDDRILIAPTHLDDTVGDFKRKFFSDAISSGNVVRLIYKGQLLRDDSRSLASYAVEDGCVVHCSISDVPYSVPVPTEAPNAAATLPGRENVHQNGAAQHRGRRVRRYPRWPPRRRNPTPEHIRNGVDRFMWHFADSLPSPDEYSPSFGQLYEMLLDLFDYFWEGLMHEDSVAQAFYRGLMQPLPERPHMNVVQQVSFNIYNRVHNSLASVNHLFDQRSLSAQGRTETLRYAIDSMIFLILARALDALVLLTTQRSVFCTYFYQYTGCFEWLLLGLLIIWRPSVDEDHEA